MMKMTYSFPEWINRQFVLWQADQGKRKTIDEFAAYLGISRPLLNMWMNGNRKPGTENIKLLEEIFGIEVYDALDLPRPNFYLQKINRLFEHLPEEVQKRFAEEAEQYEAQNLSNKSATLDQQRKKRRFNRAFPYLTPAQQLRLYILVLWHARPTLLQVINHIKYFYLRWLTYRVLPAHWVR